MFCFFWNKKKEKEETVSRRHKSSFIVESSAFRGRVQSDRVHSTVCVCSDSRESRKTISEWFLSLTTSIRTYTHIQTHTNTHNHKGIPTTSFSENRTETNETERRHTRLPYASKYLLMPIRHRHSKYTLYGSDILLYVKRVSRGDWESRNGKNLPCHMTRFHHPPCCETAPHTTPTLKHVRFCWGTEKRIGRFLERRRKMPLCQEDFLLPISKSRRWKKKAWNWKDQPTKQQQPWRWRRWGNFWYMHTFVADESQHPTFSKRSCERAITVICVICHIEESCNWCILPPPPLGVNPKEHHVLNGLDGIFRFSRLGTTG